MFTCGCSGRSRRIDRGARGARRGPGRQSASGPRPRGRALLLRRAGVTPRPRAPGGGGEPRAARPRARSAPCPRAAPRGPRRARSLAAPPAPAPRLRPVFLWARQLDGRVQAVHCEDYDPRNRIRIARGPAGWRVIPRTAIYDAVRVPRRAAERPPRAPRIARRRSRPGRPCKRPPEPAPAWLAPDLESHIPSHTIAVPRVPPAEPTPPPSEPTPLDSLLAVAELEFNQQRGAGPDLDPGPPPYEFLPDEAARDVMSFELGEPKTNEDLFFERKSHQEEDAFQNNLVVHKDLFETISEAHYLPELSGPHDEALLESLVEKGCEDNQILGQALDKIAHLVTGTGDYAEEEEEMLLSGAPVADIIDRLEQSLESPGRSSITAAQGLLHLHHIGDHLQPEHQTEQEYLADEVFVNDVTTDMALTLTPEPEMRDVNEINRMEYEQENEKTLESNVEAAETLYTEPALGTPEYKDHEDDHHVDKQPNPTLPEDSEMVPSEITPDVPQQEISEPFEETVENDADVCVPKEEVIQPEMPVSEFVKEREREDPSVCELVATDLSLKAVQKKVNRAVAETTNAVEENVSERADDMPRDLSVHRRLPTPHASPRRIEIPRAPSRESDAMQSPQPSGIPAVPSSPEIFTMPSTKSKQTLFLETLLSSPSPKMYTSEVTITKQQCEPLNLGKHRKSASPTVSSCSEEMRKSNKEFGEPQEKRIRRESGDALVKISKVFKSNKETDKPENMTQKSCEENNPLKQLQILKTSIDFNIPDPLLVPKDKLNSILAAPAKEIPALLLQRPELRLPEAFAYPSILQDPDILVISLSQLENILENDEKKLALSLTQVKDPVPEKSSNSETPKPTTPLSDQNAPPKPIHLDALATDIDAATTAALNQMFWLPYLSQLEVMAACSQNSEFLKAFNASGYSAQNYADISQMLNTSRFMSPGGFPNMMPPMDYDNRIQFAMWQEAMNQANAATARQKQDQKEMPSKSTDVQNPYVHSTKNHQSKNHSAARTSPIAHNYNTTSQRSMAHNPFFQGMYPGMNPNIRPNMPLPGLQIPYFNPNMMSQRSPRTGQQKSPTSPYYPNNNYLQSVKHTESQRSSSTGSQESPRPRISVKSLQNLLEPTAAASRVGSSGRRSSHPTSSLGRRREEPEVGSTTPLGDPPPHPMPHPHDPAAYHLWHPLFGK